MKLISNLFTKHCSCCLNCGSLWSGEGLLCHPCLQTLHRLRVTAPMTVSALPVQALYRWHPGQSDMLSRLVLALKGGNQREAWRFYARELSRRLALTLSPKQRLCIVPAPSSRPQTKDHAFLWGEALAESLGAHFEPILKKTQSHHQRGADRGERALLEMEAIENYTGSVDFSTKTRWILADDIVTTGATARAAFQALGSPPHFEVWSLAQRSLSCGASRDLL